MHSGKVEIRMFFFVECVTFDITYDITYRKNWVKKSISEPVFFRKYYFIHPIFCFWSILTTKSQKYII